MRIEFRFKLWIQIEAENQIYKNLIILILFNVS